MIKIFNSGIIYNITFFSLDSLNIDMAIFECFIAIQKKLLINLIETDSTKAHLIRLSFHN